MTAFGLGEKSSSSTFFIQPDSYINSRKEEMSDENKCESCWLYRSLCICNRLQQPKIKLPVEVKLLMHYKEYGKASNTGILLFSLVFFA